MAETHQMGFGSREPDPPGTGGRATQPTICGRIARENWIPAQNTSVCSEEGSWLRMSKVFSNGPSGDFVVNPFARLAKGASRLYLAAPYFTAADHVRDAAKGGKSVQLIVGLNAATSPLALSQVVGIPHLAVRYLTRRFHAKIFIFDDTALVGSSNLTDGGLLSNREATICFDQPDDADTVEELQALFLELWNSAQVLTDEKLQAFKTAHAGTRRKEPDPDTIIENAVGRAEPANINVDSTKHSPERIFLEQLRRQVYEEYRPAFLEVREILVSKDFRRSDLADIGADNETNRFLNWVRLTYVIGDEAWQGAPLRSEADRSHEISQLGSEWKHAENNKVPDTYQEWLDNVERVFNSPDRIKEASKEELTEGLTSLHAFAEMSRFAKGGAANLPSAFWSANKEDLSRVKASLSYLLFGPGDFIQRLHDVLYEPDKKLRFFGRFCALELYGTIKPSECPPMNGRMAKALRYLGYDVKAN